MLKFLPPLCFPLWAFGIFLSVNTAYGQQIQAAPVNDPATVWMTPAQAQIQLQDKLNVLQPQLSGLTPGTAPHTDLLRRILFYKSALRAAVKEMPTPQAIEQALPEAASMGGIYEQTFTPEATLRLLYDEAVDLLTDN